MIDPSKITNYNLTDYQLEEHILFWVCAAGKNGMVAAKCLDKLLGRMMARYMNGNRAYPFDLIKFIGTEEIIEK